MTLRFSNNFKDSVNTDIKYKGLDRYANLIFVEGNDEVYFFDKLLDSVSADPETVHVVDYSGCTKMAITLDQFMKQDYVINKKIRRVMFVADRDRFQGKISYDFDAVLKKYGIKTPAPHTFWEGHSSYIAMFGLHVIPAADKVGNLDSLLLDTIKDEEKAQEARAFVEKHYKSQSPGNDKRVAQVLLATEKELVRGVGRGFYAGYFDHNHNSIEDIRRYLRLFVSD